MRGLSLVTSRFPSQRASSRGTICVSWSWYYHVKNEISKINMGVYVVNSMVFIHINNQPTIQCKPCMAGLSTIWSIVHVCINWYIICRSITLQWSEFRLEVVFLVLNPLQNHCDVTWASLCLKSPSPMFARLVDANNTKFMKALDYWSFVRVFHRWPAGPRLNIGKDVFP